MATRILGLDIGSRFVRGVVLESQGRNVRLVQLIEEPIELIESADHAATDDIARDHSAHNGDEDTSSAPPTPVQQDDTAAEPSSADEQPAEDGDEDSVETRPYIDTIDQRAWDDATRATVERILNHADFEIDWLIAAAPEGAFMFTTIELPFNADREVRSVLGPQLDDRLPGEDQDLHLDYMVAGKADDDEQWRIYAGGLAQREMAQIMAQWQSVNADPRIIDVAPFPIFTAGEWLAPSTDRSVAYIDIGAHFTRIIIAHDGVLQMARTIPGGSEALFASIADAFEIPIESARMYQAATSTEDGDTAESDRLTSALERGLRPTMRDLRRTLTAHAARSERMVESIYVSGTALDLAALPQFITESLGMPIEVLRFDREEVNTIPNARGVSHRFTTALGLALRANPPESRSRFNLRNGDWAFRGAYAYITQRLPAILLLAGVLFFSLIFFLIARNALFKAEFRAADDGLAEISRQVFGVEVRDPNIVQNRLAQGVDGFGLHPDISAYEVVARISQAAQNTVDERMPIEMDNIDVDMSRRQVRISGVCDSANAAETFGSKLGQDNCLQSIQRTNLSQRRSDSKFEFSYTASVSCRTPDPDATDDEDESDGDEQDDDLDMNEDDVDSEEAQ